MQTGAIILCGGKSSRMGRDKATLPFGPELMLQRVVRLLSEVVDPSRIAIVAAKGQQLPILPSTVTITRDEHQGRGPLEGFSAGLDGIPNEVDAVYATSCDVPLLVPAFVSRMFQLLEDHEIAVPIENEKFHPLAAVYRPSVRRHVQKLLAAGRMRLRFLLDEADTRIVPIEELRAIDPELRTLLNLNHSEDYREALKMAGIRDEFT